MTALIQLSSGNWHVLVRRENRYVSGIFRQRVCKDRAPDMKSSIDNSKLPKPKATARPNVRGRPALDA